VNGQTVAFTPDTCVMQCYELAKYYHIDPDIFLHKPISEVQRHMRWTAKLQERINEAQEAASAMNER